MKFSGSLAIRELKRNKINLVLATIISLILFMSAFLLVNLATALPDNFYSFYEKNYSREMVIDIDDANDDLLEKCDDYFDSFSIDYQYINEKFNLSYINKEDDNKLKEFSFMQNKTINGQDIIHYYKSDYAEIGKIPDKIVKFGDEFIISGELWDVNNANYQSIWIGNNVADKLGVKVGNEITMRLELNDREPNIFTCPMTVTGIYNYEITEKTDKNFPVFYMREDFAEKTYLAIYDNYKLTGEVKNIANFYSVYNKLSKSYSLKENTVIDMIITVKNAEIICNIIGVCMLIGGMIVLMNFITMLISTNRQNIGIMLALGAKNSNIATGYGMIYAGMIAIVTIISLCLLPTINAFITLFCSAIGYEFVIKMHWFMLLAIYLICNLTMIIIMWADKLFIAKMTPTQVLTEED